MLFAADAAQAERGVLSSHSSIEKRRRLLFYLFELAISSTRRLEERVISRKFSWCALLAS